MATLLPQRWGLLTALLAAFALACAGAVYGLQSWGSYHYRAAQAALERRDFLAAGAHLQQCARLRGDIEIRLLAAKTARRQGKFAEAERQLQLCEREYSLTDDLKLEFLLLRIQQGDLRDADRTLAFYLDHQDLPESIDVLEAYIVGSLNTLRAAYGRDAVFVGSDSAAQLEKTRAAIENWLELRLDRGDQVQGLVWRFQAHAFGQSLSQAWTDIRRAVELDPNHREARYLLALYLTQEHPDEAALHLQALYDSDSQDANVSLALADVRRRLGQPEEAGELLAAILAADPENLSALLERGRVALDLQRLDQAEHWFRCAYRVDPRSAPANLALGRCLRTLGRTAEAEEFQRNLERFEAEARKSREAAMHSTERP